MALGPETYGYVRLGPTGPPAPIPFTAHDVYQIVFLLHGAASLYDNAGLSEFSGIPLVPGLVWSQVGKPEHLADKSRFYTTPQMKFWCYILIIKITS